MCQRGPPRPSAHTRIARPSGGAEEVDVGDAASMNPLPTRNTRLAWRRAAFRSALEMLDYAAGGATGITFYSVRGEILSTLSWRDVQGRAQVAARRLIGAGFGRGERLLITADTW